MCCSIAIFCSVIGYVSTVSYWYPGCKKQLYKDIIITMDYGMDLRSAGMDWFRSLTFLEETFLGLGGILD